MILKSFAAKAGVAALITASGLLSVVVGTANAAPSSTLVATPGAVSLVVGGPSQAVNVVLDSGCVNALKNGLHYTVAVGTYNSSIATVSGTSGAYNCGDSGATFTIAPVACGTTNVTFNPVVGNNGGQNPKGVQKMLSGVTVPVTVTDPANPTCGTITPGDGRGRPAAPAVANMYLNASDPAYSAACKKVAFKNAPSWRGNLISTVAGWMPKPESIKDDLSVFPTDNDWVNYVTNQVDYFCKVPGSTPSPAL